MVSLPPVPLLHFPASLQQTAVQVYAGYCPASLAEQVPAAGMLKTPAAHCLVQQPSVEQVPAAPAIREFP